MIFGFGSVLTTKISMGGVNMKETFFCRTKNILQWFERTIKLKNSDGDSPGGNRHDQDAPPPDLVTCCPLTQSPKKEQKRELDGPQAANEYHVECKNGFEKVLRLIPPFGCKFHSTSRNSNLVIDSLELCVPEYIIGKKHGICK